MDLTILKSDKDLSGVEPIKGLNYKEVTADEQTELLIYRIPFPFNNSLGNFRVSSIDIDEKPIINGYIYIFIELQGIQFVIYTINHLNSKEDISLYNSYTTKHFRYGVNKFRDTLKYFYIIASTPIRIL